MPDAYPSGCHKASQHIPIAGQLGIPAVGQRPRFSQQRTPAAPDGAKRGRRENRGRHADPRPGAAAPVGSGRSAAEIAEAEGGTRSFVNRMLPLTLLAPTSSRRFSTAGYCRAYDKTRGGRTLISTVFVVYQRSPRSQRCLCESVASNIHAGRLRACGSLLASSGKSFAILIHSSPDQAISGGGRQFSDLASAC
jgi:hypothetical protein